MPRAPSKKNILYGKGVVYVAPLDSQGNPEGEIDIGEAPTFTLEPVIEKDKIPSSRKGVRETAFAAIVETGMTLRFSTRDYNRENINLAFLGDGMHEVSQGSGYEPGKQITVDYLDRWYPLGKRNCSNIVVKGEGGTPIYVEGTDYKVDTGTRLEGRIMPLSEGSISKNDTIEVDFNYSAWSAVEIRKMTEPQLECYIRFIGDPEYGPLLEAELWRVQLQSSAEMPLISEGSEPIEFEGEVMIDRDNHPDKPFGRILVNEDWPI